MAGKIEFRKKLAGIVTHCVGKGGVVSKKEVEEFFRDDQLSQEQMELVFDYLMSQKIVVKGYVKTGGTVRTAAEETTDTLTAEEKAFLDRYLEDLDSMPQGDEMTELLRGVVQAARSMERGEIFLGDLIQEGSMGIVMSMEKDLKNEERIIFATEMMRTFIEEQNEEKLRDKKMVDKVNDLDQQITKLTEEMGRKISVDELMEFLDISEEEVADTLRLAGEELPPDEISEKENP